MSSQQNHAARLKEKLFETANADARRWLEAAMEQLLVSDAPEDDLLRFSAMARRRLGEEQLSRDASCSLETPHGSLETGYWEKGDAGRILLLLELIGARPEAASHWVRLLFRQGDEAERSAVVRALVLFPDPRTLKPIALEAGRCNSLALYSALALLNPYPAAFYDEAEFNQVVLKSLFTGLDISLVTGLGQRANRELSRMCEDYVDERLAAGRSVPTEIWLAIGPDASEHGTDLLLRFLDDENAAHRYYSAVALAGRLSSNPELRAALAGRLARETEAGVRNVLEKGLAA